MDADREREKKKKKKTPTAPLTFACASELNLQRIFKKIKKSKPLFVSSRLHPMRSGPVKNIFTTDDQYNRHCSSEFYTGPAGAEAWGLIMSSWPFWLRKKNHLCI